MRFCTSETCDFDIYKSQLQCTHLGNKSDEIRFAIKFRVYQQQQSVLVNIGFAYNHMVPIFECARP